MTGTSCTDDARVKVKVTSFQKVTFFYNIKNSTETLPILFLFVKRCFWLPWYKTNKLQKLCFTQTTRFCRGPGRGVPVSHIPLIILKISHIPKIGMANIHKFSKHCISISPNLTQVSCIPFNIYKTISYPFKFLANIPVSLKTFPGPLCHVIAWRQTLPAAK